MQRVIMCTLNTAANVINELRPTTACAPLNVPPKPNTTFPYLIGDDVYLVLHQHFGAEGKARRRRRRFGISVKISTIQSGDLDKPAHIGPLDL